MDARTFRWGDVGKYVYVAPNSKSVTFDVTGTTETPRNIVKQIHEYLGQWLEETKPRLPTKPYAVIYAVTRYTEDSKGEIHRLVLVPAPMTDTNEVWLDWNGDAHDPSKFEEIQVISEGIDLPLKIIA